MRCLPDGGSPTPTRTRTRPFAQHPTPRRWWRVARHRATHNRQEHCQRPTDGCRASGSAETPCAPAQSDRNHHYGTPTIFFRREGPHRVARMNTTTPAQDQHSVQSTPKHSRRLVRWPRSEVLQSVFRSAEQRLTCPFRLRSSVRSLKAAASSSDVRPSGLLTAALRKPRQRNFRAASVPSNLQPVQF